MAKKVLIILITIVVVIGAGILGYSLYTNSTSTTTTPTATTTDSGYKSFNPFSNDTTSTTDTSTTNGGDTTQTANTTNSTEQGSEPIIVKFHQITNFAVAGATFFIDSRPLPAPATNTQSTDTQTQTGDTQTTTTVAAPDTTKTTTPTPTAKKGVVKKATVKAKVAAPKIPTTEPVPAIRYVERATGHIYERYLDNKNEGKISNSTIPSIYEALFDGSAKTIIYRYLSSDEKSISSFIASLGGPKGEFLPSGINDMALSVDKTKLFYLVSNTNGVTGTVKSLTDTKKSVVFSSAYSEWIPQWVGDTTIYLTTKAASSVNGSLFKLNTTSGVLTKVLGGIAGLTTLANPTGTQILYNTSYDYGPKLSIFNTSNHLSTDLSVYGLPEKCIWSISTPTLYCALPNTINGSQYPEVWYQGQVSFDDHIVKINTITGQISTIADSTNETPVDATHLFLDDKEENLFFINKKDSTLWSLDLK